jgi:hypothetical protein
MNHRPFDKQEQIVRFYSTFVGCARCGRFHMDVESVDSEHRRGWIRATCIACLFSEERPLKTAEQFREDCAAAEKSATATL